MRNLTPVARIRFWSKRAARLTALVVVLSLTMAPSLAAQDGTITGRVVDAEDAEPVAGSTVELLDGMRVLRSTATGPTGDFRLTDVPAGNYSLVFSSVGYETRRRDGIEVRVGGGTVTLGTIQLTSQVFNLNPIVVSVSREREKALNAPASVYTVDTEEIEEEPATTPADHVIGLPGVDVVSTGIAQHNVVARGFNNVFSGALFVLTDNRWASVPSLRFNAYNLIPVTNEDIERIELVLGPGSALYGPNVDKGVMHIITRSPFDHQGTSLSLMGGERDVFQGTLRHAGLFSDNIGYKISGMYSRGDDWSAVSQQELDQDSVPRDFEQERFLGDLRLDFRLDDQSTLAFNAGATRMASSLEMTGIGTAQALDWTYTYAQARFWRGRFFAQSYINLSDAGDSFTLRDADTITDNSLLYVGQVQHGVDIGERQSLTYGADLIRTVPRTDGEINGRNEDEDNLTEVGAYVQSETQLSPMFDLVAAARVDYHNVVDDLVFSPRGALVFKPTDAHSLRFTYNRAFSQPTTNNLFLDKLSATNLSGLPFPVRGRGAPEGGFTFRRDCTVPATGQTGLCMRSPFTPAAAGGPITSVPLDATLYWDAAVEVIRNVSPQLGGVLDLFQAPTANDIGSALAKLNPTTRSFDPVTAAAVADVPQTVPSITNTLEFGYKGLIAERLLVGLDVYYTKVEDFIGPLLVETPNVFFNPFDVGPYVVSELQRLANQGFIAPEDIPALAPALTQGLSQVPVGIVTPEQVSASVDPDIDPLDPTTIILAYRNFPSFDLWGADLGLTLLATDWLRFTGTYSFVSENFFTASELGAPSDLALNSPKNKASLGAHYSNERLGLRGEVRGRYVDSFPVISGVFIGDVENYTLFDVLVSYTLPISRSTQVSLNVSNVFDNEHREMVGAPELGRLVLLRVRQSF